MGLNILHFMVTALIFSRLTQQQATTPEQRCQSGSSVVCIDCFRRGICEQNPDGSYTVIYDDTCPTAGSSPTYCDDTISSYGVYGICYPLSGTISNCTCTSITQCIADPNNPNVVLHCEYSPPVIDPSCPANKVIDFSTCGCKTCSETCPLLDDPNDDCRSYFVCNGPELIPITCADNTCFNQESCKCEEPPTPTCPPGCGLVDNPDGGCDSFFVCAGTELIPVNCSDNYCFDQASCGCVEVLTSSPDCLFVDDPNDNCRRF